MTDVIPRLQTWLKLLKYLTGADVLNLVLIAGTPLLLVKPLLATRHPPIEQGSHTLKCQSARVARQTEPRKRVLALRSHVLSDLALVLFTLFYISVHTVMSFRIYDRYLLGLVPLTSILLARICGLPGWMLAYLRSERVRSGLYRALPALLLLFVVLTVARPTRIALEYGFPIGGDYLNRYAGIDQVANYFRANAPPGTIIFDRWLGWHYAFYLFDLPVEYAHHQTNQDVLATAELHPDRQKYVVFPSWTDPQDLKTLLAENGWDLQKTYTTFRTDGTVSFTVYRITSSPLASRRTISKPSSMQTS